MACENMLEEDDELSTRLVAVVKANGYTKDALSPRIAEVVGMKESREDKPAVELCVDSARDDNIDEDGVGLTLVAFAWTTADPSVGSGTLPLMAQPLVGPGQAGAEKEGE